MLLWNNFHLFRSAKISLLLLSSHPVCLLPVSITYCLFLTFCFLLLSFSLAFIIVLEVSCYRLLCYCPFRCFVVFGLFSRVCSLCNSWVSLLPKRFATTASCFSLIQPFVVLVNYFSLSVFSLFHNRLNTIPRVLAHLT